MSESSISPTEFPETSIPLGGAPLESILFTDELGRRPSRPADYEKESRALVELAGALADSPSTIFRTLAERIRDITQSDSAGLSLLTNDGETPHVDGKRFYWPAIVGMWNVHVGGGTPRNFGPCGDVLDQNRTLLFRHFERRYPYLIPVNPAAEECLLVPFYVADKAVGTIWAIMHSDRRVFDAEDARVMASLGKFASSAYQAVTHIEALKIQVSERERAEAEVRKLASSLEAKVRRLVDANVVGIAMFTVGGAITAANEAFLRMVQYNREDLAAGRVRWTDLTPPEWRDRDDLAITELKSTGSLQPFEKEYIRKDGSRLPVLFGGALFEGNGNEGVAFILDLGKQKRAEQARDKARSELAHVARVVSLGTLAASIAHELNQPLSGIVVNASTCERMLAAKNIDGALETVRGTVRDANRASEVITRLRSLFNNRNTATESVDLNEAAREVLELSMSELQRNRVVVRTELEEDLARVTADRVQLQQVILNLLRNAADAMSTIDDRPRDLLIRTEHCNDDQVRLSVRDVGAGLSAQAAERLFEAFFTTKSDGMGIGLAISRSIIENHHGRLWGAKNDGPGSMFSFSIPCTRLPDSSRRANAG